MCDFSLQHAKSRPAVQADVLISADFGRGTVGFKAASDEATGDQATAVCILPGTELAFAEPVKFRWSYSEDACEGKYTTAIFRQKDKEIACTHHDVLEFPDGQQQLLTRLAAGQTCSVLQLPALPKTPEEVAEQTRAAYVG